jgi:hypothetical protein
MSTERTGVLVHDGIVINVVVWGDESDEQFADDGYQHFEETTDMERKPRLGWTWNEEDGYRPPSPFPSWVYNNDAGVWEAPEPMPTEGGPFQWNEETQTWESMEE